LNPDCIVDQETIFGLRNQLLSDNSIGIIAPQLRDINNKSYLSCTAMPNYLNSFVVYSFLDTRFPRNRFSVKYWYKDYPLDKKMFVGSASGAAMMMRKSDFLLVKGFDEQYFMYWEDGDLCRKIQKLGKKILYFPEYNLIHKRGGSTNNKLRSAYSWFIRSRYLYFRKYYSAPLALLLELWLRPQSYLAMRRNRIC
jgi:GT2 family glycosyltransferase